MFSLALAAVLSAGQCQGGVCRPQAFPVLRSFPVQETYAWRESRHAGQLDLFCGPAWIGSLRTSDRVYLPVVGNGWGQPCEPPTARPLPAPKPGCGCGCADGKPCECLDCPGPAIVGQVDPNPGGVDAGKIAEYGKRYSVSGRQTGKREAFNLIERRSLTDDSAKGFIVYTGPDPAGFASEAKAIPELADYHIQTYKPEDRMAAARGYAVPGVVALKADGTELARMEATDKAAKLAELLRRKKDGGGLFNPTFTIDATWLFVAAAFVAGLLIRRQPPQVKEKS